MMSDTHATKFPHDLKGSEIFFDAPELFNSHRTQEDIFGIIN